MGETVTDVDTDTGVDIHKVKSLETGTETKT